MQNPYKATCLTRLSCAAVFFAAGAFAFPQISFAIDIVHGDVNGTSHIGTLENGAVQIERVNDATQAMSRGSDDAQAAPVAGLSPCITTFSGPSVFTAMGTYNALANTTTAAVASAAVAGCTYTVSSDSSGWLTPTNTYNGPPGVVSYIVAQNNSSNARTAHLHIAGAGVSFSFTVSQYPAGDTNYRNFSGIYNYYYYRAAIVWRPVNGTWYINNGDGTGSNATTITQQWGLPDDRPVLGDFDGDGIADIAIWRPSIGTWYVLPSANPTQPVTQPWGLPGDIPVPGDYDGDGKTDFAVFRPSDQTWWIIQSSTNVGVWQQLGMAGDIPVPGGDYDGDGKADLAVFRSSTATWYIRGSRDGTIYAIPFGATGDIPVPNRLDTQTVSKLTVWRPTTAMWYQRDLVGNQSQQQYGLPGDIPLLISGNPAVWRPAGAVWYASSTVCCNTYNWPLQWGLGTDVLPEAPHTASQ